MKKVTLITGSSRGIGRACAAALAHRGYAVCINYIERQDKAEELCQKLIEDGCEAMTFRADVSDRKAVHEMVEAVRDRFGEVTLLVNNAGIARQSLFQDISEEYRKAGKHDVIIADEAQFFTPEQIDQLRCLVDTEDLPVLCFGLRTDFLTHFFPGARRLMELADSITEVKTVCACGRKATVNARIDRQGRIVTQGSQVLLGGNDSYVAMCHKCWKQKIAEQEK